MNKKEDIFSTVFWGWFYGITAIFLPIFLVVAISMIISGSKDSTEMIVSVFLVPVIAAGQGLIVGAIVLFGLFVSKLFKRNKDTNES